MPVNVYEVVFSIGGNFYTGLSSSALAVYDPTGGFTTGSGTFFHNSVPANFSFNGKYKNDGTINGSFLYIEHRSTGDVRVQGSAFQTLTVLDKTAVFIANVTLNGVSGYTAQITTVDNGEPGVNSDTLAMQLTAPDGSTVSDLTFPAITINGGDIQIHN